MSEKTLYMHDLDSSIIPLSLQFRKTTKVLIYSIYERSGYIHFHITEEQIETNNRDYNTSIATTLSYSDGIK